MAGAVLSPRGKHSDRARERSEPATSEAVKGCKYKEKAPAAAPGPLEARPLRLIREARLRRPRPSCHTSPGAPPANLRLASGAGCKVAPLYGRTTPASSNSV